MCIRIDWLMRFILRKHLAVGFSLHSPVDEYIVNMNCTSNLFIIQWGNTELHNINHHMFSLSLYMLISDSEFAALVPD